MTDLRTTKEQREEWSALENDTQIPLAVRTALPALSSLEALEAENARLKEALRPFAERANRYDPDEGDGDDPDWSTSSPDIRIRDLRRARAAMGESE